MYPSVVSDTILWLVKYIVKTYLNTLFLNLYLVSDKSDLTHIKYKGKTMEYYPKDHASFLLWAKKTSDTLSKSTRGEVRIGKNKLAAIMASSLPGAPFSFNINTLKKEFDMEPVGSNQKLFSALITERMLKVFVSDFDFASAFKAREEFENECVYHILDEEGSIADFYSELVPFEQSEIDAAKRVITIEELENYTEQLCSCKDSFDEKVSVALNEMTKDFVLIYLDVLADFCNNNKSIEKNADILKLSQNALSKIDLESPSLWVTDLLKMKFSQSLTR